MVAGRGAAARGFALLRPFPPLAEAQCAAPDADGVAGAQRRWAGDARAVRRVQPNDIGPSIDRDDPLVAPLRQLGEPMYLLDSNPTVERIARLIFEYATDQGLPVVRVRVWETPTSFAEYGGGSSRAS